MATDYSKKTNAELIEILKSRSLPHTGKKADLVARLQQDDEKTNAKTDPAEDVIDWDDDVPAEEPTTEAGANAMAAGGKGVVANPVAVPNQELDTDANPATADDLTVESTGAAAAVTGQPDETATDAEKKAAVVDFSQGLAASELEEELRKRKARAAKFGIVEDTETALKEAEKQLERAKRFGTAAGAEATTAVGIRGLDEALPNEPSRKRSRNDQGGRGGKRRDNGRNHNHRGGNNNNQNRRRGGGGGGGGEKEQSGQRSWSDKDALAMEARKKRFATAA